MQATPADFEHLEGGVIDEHTLRRAQERVEHAIRTSRFNPRSDRVRQDLVRAVCAQAADWQALGSTGLPSRGSSWQRVTNGPVTLERSTSRAQGQDAVDPADQLTGRARRILLDAGLLPAKVRV